MASTTSNGVLQQLGLRAESERVYFEVLNSPVVDKNELIGALNLTEYELRDELNNLCDLNLVRRHTDHPATGERYSALPPDQAIEVLIADTQTKIEEQRITIEAARESVPSLVENFLTTQTGRTSDVCEDLHRPDLVRSRLYQLTHDATSDVLFMIKGPAFSAEATAASQRLDADLLARGVTLRVLTSRLALQTPHWLDYVKAAGSNGVHVRVHDVPPLLAVVIDGQDAVLPKAGDRGAWVLHGADFCAPIQALFETTWHNASNLTASEADSETLSPRQRQVLALLADGATDEVIARRLGCSARTVGRLVSEICDALDAGSRFQAGVIAASRGWVTTRRSG